MEHRTQNSPVIDLRGTSLGLSHFFPRILMPTQVFTRQREHRKLVGVVGVLRVRVRAANAGYMLRRWSVDCSLDHHLRGMEYALGLRDPLVLYGASNAHLAPGYKDPRSDREVKAL